MKLQIRCLLKPTLLLLLVAVSFIGCKSDTNVNQSPNADLDKKETTKSSNHVQSSHAAIMVGLWHYAKMVADPEVVELYRGRWIDFKRDDTFVSGIYDKETNRGTWSLTDSSTSELTLKYDKEEKGIATQWNVQGAGDYVVWKGNAGANQTGFQIKMVLHLERDLPKKE